MGLHDQFGAPLLLVTNALRLIPAQSRLPSTPMVQYAAMHSMIGRITAAETRWRKLRISNTWTQLYKVMVSAQEKERVQAGWNGWRRIPGVICDRRVPARVKGKVYKLAVRPAMLYGLETVVLTKRQEAEMEMAELKMLRF